MITLLVCYVMWCLQGCTPLGPCISDLGLVSPMRETFAAGLTAGALLLMLALLDVYIIRRRLLNAINASGGWHCFNIFLAISGMAINVGVGAIGYFPWNEHLDLHMACANTIFYGGTAWGLGNSYVLKRYQQDPTTDPSWQTMLERSRYLQLGLLAVSFISLTAMETADAVTGAFDQPGYLDFQNFCEASRFDGVGFHALCEWILIISLVGGVSTVLVDYQLYFGKAIGSRESLVAKGPQE